VYRVARRRLLGLVVGLLNRLVPKRRAVVLCTVPDFDDTGLALVEEMIGRVDRIVWLTNDEPYVTTLVRITSSSPMVYTEAHGRRRLKPSSMSGMGCRSRRSESRMGVGV
jgi:hypothetical protein